MYVTVILPLKLEKILTYSVREDMQSSIVVGGRVTLSVGASKIYTAIVLVILEQPPLREIKYKNIISIIDTKPIIPEQQIWFWNWIARYYITFLGTVMKRFLPSPFLIKGSVVNSSEVVYDNYREIEVYRVVKLLDTNKEEVLAKLGRKAKQKEAYIDILNFCEKQYNNEIPVKELYSIGYTTDILRKLSQLGVVEFINKQGIRKVEVISHSKVDTAVEVELFDVESSAVEQLLQNCSEKSVSLLHNNCSLGSENVVFGLAAKYVNNSKNVLIITPDSISCGTFAKEARDIFGNSVVEYSSALSGKKIYDTYRLVNGNNGLLVVGNSNSLGLPFDQLDLIVVISEHDRLHKSDSAPRLVARDCAIMLGRTYGCAVVLESRTPSVESYYNAQQNKYKLVTLDDGGGVFEKCKVSLISKFDISRAEKQGSFNRSSNRFLSKYLISRIGDNIVNGEVSFLYKNQLGYSRYMICEHCGYVPNCEKCNTSMYFNRGQKKLMCSICGFTVSHKENVCNRCESSEVEYRGYGTENINSSIIANFPEGRTLKFDRENLKGVKNINAAVESINSKGVDVVIGTGMLMRDYGFRGIATSSIVDCDTILNSSDFRSEERCFQTAMYFMKCSSELVIQSFKADYSVLKHIVRRNYKDMYTSVLSDRKMFDYPPFSRIIRITIKHRDEMSVSTTTMAIFDKLVTFIDSRGLVISKPIVDKIRNRFIMNITISMTSMKNISDIKSHIWRSVSYFAFSKYFRGYVYDIDVDVQ